MKVRRGLLAAALVLSMLSVVAIGIAVSAGTGAQATGGTIIVEN
jgi:hypothetical protein